MTTDLPSVTAIRDLLASLGHAGSQRLAKLSGVPFSTIWKIRDGTTRNPGIETVAQFLPHVDAARAADAQQPEAAPVVSAWGQQPAHGA